MALQNFSVFQIDLKSLFDVFKIYVLSYILKRLFFTGYSID